MAAVNPEEFFAELEEFGEEGVRTKLRSKQVWGGAKASLAEDWLERKSEERSSADRREERAIARDAALSARKAAREASEANRLAREANDSARQANMIAIGAVIAAIVIPVLIAILS